MKFFLFLLGTSFITAETWAANFPTPTSFAEDALQRRCQSVTFKFNRVTGAKYYQLYRDGRAIRNVSASSFGSATKILLSDWSIDAGSGVTYQYQVGASKESIAIGKKIPKTSSSISAPSSTISFRATASNCNALKDLKRLVVVSLAPSNIGYSSSGTIDRLNEVFNSKGAGSFRTYLSEISQGKLSPDILVYVPRKLPRVSSAYANQDLRAKYVDDFIKIKDSLVAANSTLGDKSTLFIMPIKGSISGAEYLGQMVLLPYDAMASGKSISSSLSQTIHEVGHHVLDHSSTITCSSPLGALFGYHPVQDLLNGDCKESPSDYADPTDSMGAGSMHYSAYSKHIMGFLGNLVTLDQKSIQKEKGPKHYRLYSSRLKSTGLSGALPDMPSRVATQLIKFQLNGLPEYGSSSYWIEYKDDLTFNNAKFTGDARSIPASVIVKFRLGVPIGRGGIQTYVPGGNLSNSYLTIGVSRLLDESSGLTVEVTDITKEYADITLSW